MRAQGRSPLRVAIVGEAPSRTSGSAPFDGRSGTRLAQLAGVAELDAAFALYNVLDRWPGAAAKGSVFRPADARREAQALLERLAAHDRVVVAGHRAAAAFGIRDATYLRWFDGPTGRPWAVLPHPSGVNRWFNDPRNVRRARRFLRKLRP